MKELLFNGARRDIAGKFELGNNPGDEASVKVRSVTPYQLMFHFRSEIPENEFKSLRIILVRNLLE